MRKIHGRRSLPSAVADRRTGAEVHLGLLGRLGLHPPKRQRDFLPQPGDEPPHAVVARRLLAVVLEQVLVNPHRFQPLLDLRQDLSAEGLALAPPPAGWGRRAGGRYWLVRGRNARKIDTSVTTSIPPVWIVERIPGGRYWLVLGLGPRQILADRLPIHPQKGGNFAVRVTGFVECKDRIDFGHRESFRHLGSPSAWKC